MHDWQPTCPAPDWQGLVGDQSPSDYGVTACLVVVLYFSLFFSEAMTSKQLLVVIGTLALLFPLWFSRYARGLWIAFGEHIDPWPIDESD